MVHAALNVGAVTIMLGSSYVAYSVKEGYGKPHLTTTHSWFGASAGEHCIADDRVI